MTDNPAKPELKLIPNLETDPFDPQRLRLSAADMQAPATEEKLTVEVRKPNRTDFNRVHPSSDYTIDLEMLEFDRRLYVVDLSVRPLLRLDTKPMQIFTCVSRAGAVFLWAISLNTGSDNPWVTSAR